MLNSTEFQQDDVEVNLMDNQNLIKHPLDANS